MCTTLTSMLAIEWTFKQFAELTNSSAFRSRLMSDYLGYSIGQKRLATQSSRERTKMERKKKGRKRSEARRFEKCLYLAVYIVAAWLVRYSGRINERSKRRRVPRTCRGGSIACVNRSTREMKLVLSESPLRGHNKVAIGALANLLARFLITICNIVPIFSSLPSAFSPPSAYSPLVAPLRFRCSTACSTSSPL